MILILLRIGNKRLEAKTFDEDLKEGLVHLILVVPELPHMMRYIHEKLIVVFI